MAKKNTTVVTSSSISSISSISSTSITVGTREVVSIAVSRIETSLRQQLTAARATLDTLEKDSSLVQKKISKLVTAQAKALTTVVTSHLDALALMNKELSVTVQSSLEALREDNGSRCSDGAIIGYNVQATVTLTNGERTMYGQNRCVIQAFSEKASDEVLAGIKELDEVNEKIEVANETIAKLSKDLSGLPSAERQFTARMAEKVLSGSEGGKAMLAEVSEAIKAMGFGSLPQLT